MIGIKNRGHIIPLYADISFQQCEICTAFNWKGIASPINSFPPFGMTITDENGSIASAVFTLKKRCDPDFSLTLDDQLLLNFEWDSENGETTIQYTGALIDPVVPGTYYFCLNIAGQLCYSEELHMCDIGCGVEVTDFEYTVEDASCCNEITLPANAIVRVWRRVSGTNWQVFHQVAILQSAIINAGGTNLIFNHQLFDNSNNNPIPWTSGGGSTDNSAFAASIPTSILEARSEGYLEADFVCGDGIHRLRYSWIFIVPQPTSAIWAFDVVDLICEDLMPSKLVTFTANDNISSAIQFESIDWFFGGGWINIGTNSGTVTVPAGTELLIRRRITTDCNKELVIVKTINV